MSETCYPVPPLVEGALVISAEMNCPQRGLSFDPKEALLSLPALRL
jgi:hypothetical protein